MPKLILVVLIWQIHNSIEIGVLKQFSPLLHLGTFNLLCEDDVNLESEQNLARVQAQGKNSGPASKARYFVKRPFS